MARIVTYRRDRPNDFSRHSDGSAPMSSFVISSQIRRPCVEAAHAIIGIARSIAPKGEGAYAAAFGIGRRERIMFKPAGEPLQPRAVAEVINTSDKAPAIEWGSGPGNDGAPGTSDRPQGGSNQPFRVLGRAGARVGDFHE